MYLCPLPSNKKLQLKTGLGIIILTITPTLYKILQNNAVFSIINSSEESESEKCRLAGTFRPGFGLKTLCQAAALG
jgi:hypothetical protein